MDPFTLIDELGPHQILHLCEPAQSLRALLVIDNLALGPALGSVSMEPNASLEDIVHQARFATLLQAAAEVPHGGARAVVLASAALDHHRKRTLLRCFASALASRQDIILMPGVGTDEECMAWLQDEGLRAVGRPRELGGTGIGVAGAIGLGMSAAVAAAADYSDLRLAGARVAFAGFGQAVRHAARHLADAGARVVAVGDERSAIHAPQGLNVYALRPEGDGVQLALPPGARRLTRDALAAVDCDVWVASLGCDTIQGVDGERIRARLVVEASRSAVSAEAQLALQRRGVVTLPDCIALAGGAVGADLELRGVPGCSMTEELRRSMAAHTRSVLGVAVNEHRLPSAVARSMALDRLEKASATRRWSVYAGSGAPGLSSRDERAAFQP